MTLEVAEGVGATVNREAVRGRVPLHLADPSTKRLADRVGLGRVTLHLHQSGERLAVRLRDPASPLRERFAGLRWFDIDSRWQITGRVLRYEAPRAITIRNILGDLEESISPGEVEFLVDGQPVRLVALQSGDRLWFVFRDLTAGRDTYRIRCLYADAPAADGRVLLDFNRAYNPPCAYNPHTTCPVPLPQNRLNVAIPAGEKLYVHSSSTHHGGEGATAPLPTAQKIGEARPAAAQARAAR